MSVAGEVGKAENLLLSPPRQECKLSSHLPSPSTREDSPQNFACQNKLIYVQYKDHVFFKNIENPAAEAVIREAIGWVKNENEDVLLLECDRCVKPCPVKPQTNSYFDSFPDENSEFFKDDVVRTTESVKHYEKEVGAFATALVSLGIDLAAVDLDEAISGKKKRVKKPNQQKKEVIS